ncbi:MAG: hypothetical protein ACKVX7_05685 [Planctomycetota bacterium]
MTRSLQSGSALRGVLAMTVILVVVVGVAAYLANRRSAAPSGVSSAAPAGWRAHGGPFTANANRWTARAAGRLELPQGLRAEVAADTVFDASQLTLPRVAAGSMRIEFPAGAEFDGLRAEERAELEFSPVGARLIAGRIWLDQRLLLPPTVIAATQRGWAPIPEPTVAPGSDPIASPPSATAPISGQVLDAATGEPLVGARILVTFTHSPDGYPALPIADARRELVSDANGNFAIPPLAPDDARLKAHLQCSHAGFMTMVRVLAEPPDLDGRWIHTKLSMRRAFTLSARFLDSEQRPLAGLAVSVREPRIPAPSALAIDVVSALRPQLDGDATTIYYTDDAGELAIVDGWQVPIGTLDPEWDTPRDATRWPAWYREHLAERERFASRDEPFAPIFLQVAPPLRAEYVLLDQGQRPVVGALLEVQIAEDARWFRTTTDAEGRFGIGVSERTSDGAALAVEPKRCVATVLDPQLFRHTAEFGIPSVEPRVWASGQIAPRLRFTVAVLKPAGEDDTAPLAHPAEQPFLDGAMTLLSRTRTGETVWQGQPPNAGKRVLTQVRDALPLELAMPNFAGVIGEVDLGQVVFAPGAAVTLRFVGVEPSALEDAVLRLRTRVGQPHRWHIGRDGVARVAGLELGHACEYSVESSHFGVIAGRFFCTASAIDEGLELDLRDPSLVPTRLATRLTGIPADETPRYRVIEHYTDERTRTTRLYPLAPDGGIGSAHYLSWPQEASVYVLAPDGRLAQGGPRGFVGGLHALDPATNARSFAPRVFDFGPLQLVPSGQPIFSFRVAGYGVVPPPEACSITRVPAGGGVAELVARGFELQGRYLEAGVDYSLNCRLDATESWSARVRIDPRELRPRLVFELDPELRQRAVIELVGPDRRPLDGARLVAFALSDDGVVERHEGVASGVAGSYVVTLRSDLPNRLEIERAGLLKATIELPAGRGLEVPVTLYRGVEVAARILDAAGRAHAGAIVVRWDADALVATDAADAGVRVRHGEDLRFTVVGGQFRGGGFPPGERVFTFEDAASPASATRSLALAAAEQTIGAVTLEERQRVRGVVLLPNGRPAVGARVALVEATQVGKYPFRERKTSDLRSATIADADGSFILDLLLVDVRAPDSQQRFALIAELDGYTSAIESPFELEFVEHRLVLGATTAISIVAGYQTRVVPEGFEFRLYYEPLGAVAEPARLLASIAPQTPSLWRDVEPGRYRLEWGPTSALPGVSLLASEVTLLAGRAVDLQFEIPGETVRGRALLAPDRPLTDGWVVFFADPGDLSQVRVVSVRDGRFAALLPAAEPLFASLIPRTDPLELFDFSRGEGLPVEIDFATQGRGGEIEVLHEAYDLTIIFSAETLASARHGLAIEIPSYEWRGSSWREDSVEIPVTGDRIRLRRLPPGTFRFTVKAAGVSGWSTGRRVDLREDTVITFDR